MLIDVLGQLPTYENSRVEDLLFQLAEDKGPSIYPGSDEASRKKYHEAWKAWWTEHGEKIDLTKLEEAGKTLGYTLVVLIDKGKVIDLDNANKPRFEIGDLELPLDIQLLPDDHVLVAEHIGNRVTRTHQNRENRLGEKGRRSSRYLAAAKW